MRSFRTGIVLTASIFLALLLFSCATVQEPAPAPEATEMVQSAPEQAPETETGSAAGQTPASDPEPVPAARATDEEAAEAFVYSFLASFLASMSANGQRELPGVTVDASGRLITMTEVDLEALLRVENDRYAYESVSGTIDWDGERMDVVVTLATGPVTSVSFAISQGELAAEGPSFVDLLVDGEERTIQISETDFQ